MMGIRYLLICILLLQCAGCGNEGQSLQTLNNETISVASLKNQWVLVYYWASWCSGCKANAPKMNQLAKDFKDQIKVFGVNIDPQDSPTHPYGFSQLTSSPHDIFAFKMPKAIPAVVFIHQNKAKHIHYGPISDGLVKKYIQARS